MQISNKTYDILKWVAQLLLPALATFVMSLGNIWGIPYSEQISLTLVALDTALGVVLGISTSNYKKLNDTEIESTR
jgi:hypothetical protein